MERTARGQTVFRVAFPEFDCFGGFRNRHLTLQLGIWTRGNVSSEKMAGQQCCQHSTTFCLNPGNLFCAILKCILRFLKVRFFGTSYTRMVYILMTIAVLLINQKILFIDIKIVGTVSSATECTLLQSDIDSLRG
jgi:hypothetical protein